MMSVCELHSLDSEDKEGKDSSEQISSPMADESSGVPLDTIVSLGAMSATDEEEEKQSAEQAG